MVSEQSRNDEERDFRVWPRKKMGRFPAILLAPFFAPSLTLVPRSLLQNLTETLVFAKQANQETNGERDLVCSFK